VVATLTGSFPTFCRRHRLTKIRNAVHAAYFASPPLAAFLVAFFLAIVPPFLGWTPQRAKTVDAAPQNLTGAIIRKFALLREPYHSLRADSHITLRAIAPRGLADAVHVHVSRLIQGLTCRRE